MSPRTPGRSLRCAPFPRWPRLVSQDADLLPDPRLPETFGVRMQIAEAAEADCAGRAAVNVGCASVRQRAPLHAGAKDEARHARLHPRQPPVRPGLVVGRRVYQGLYLFQE